MVPEGIRHLEWVQAHRAPSTYELRQFYVFQFLEFLGLGELQGERLEITGSMTVLELTRGRLTDFHLWARRRSGNKVNGGNQALRHIKTMLRWGEEEELCGLPFRKFPPISQKPPATKRVSLDDVAKLIETAPEDVGDLVKFGLLTGLRPQELRELTTDQVVQVSDEIWYIRIERHKTAGRARDSVARTVPVCEPAREILLRQIQAHPDQKHVFLNDDGVPYTRTVLRNRLIRWSRKAKIQDITPYALRHTFASVQSDSRIESTALARLMGHSSVRTLARYISNSSQHDFEAVQVAASALDKALEKTS